MMSDVHYTIVEHDGGWAYKLGEVFSETFRSHDDARDAADIAAAEQMRGDEDAVIEYQNAEGRWTVETAKGSDRPEVDVEG